MLLKSHPLEAVQKVSKSLLRRYTLPKFQLLVVLRPLAKLIALIINSFCSMLCRGVLQTPIPAGASLQLVPIIPRACSSITNLR